MKFLPFSRFTIHGNSMLPTLKPGQDILCFTWAYVFFKPKIGDIVVIRQGGREIVKRIQKRDDHRFFVIGDNRKESTDSREFGAIGKSKIVGKVLFIQ